MERLLPMSSTRRQLIKWSSGALAVLLGSCMPQRLWAFHGRHRRTSCCPPPCAPCEVQVLPQGTYTICFPLLNMQVPSCGGAAIYVWGYGLAQATKAVCTWDSQSQDGTSVSTPSSLGQYGWAYYFHNLPTNKQITLTVSGGTGTQATTVQFSVN
jgi:hypothetical protein